MDSTTEAPALTPVEAAVNSIPDAAQREVLTKRMEEMASCAIEANKSLEELKAELEQHKQQAGTDAAATKDAVEMFIESLGPEISRRWNADRLAGYNKPEWPAIRQKHGMASHERINAMDNPARAKRQNRNFIPPPRF